MIITFGNEETEKIFWGEVVKKLPINLQKITRRKLRMVHNAHHIKDLRVPPGNRLEALKGNLEGFHSIRVNCRWRIIFKWDSGECHDVTLIDYH